MSLPLVSASTVICRKRDVALREHERESILSRRDFYFRDRLRCSTPRPCITRSRLLLLISVQRKDFQDTPLCRHTGRGRPFCEGMQISPAASILSFSPSAPSSPPLSAPETCVPSLSRESHACWGANVPFPDGLWKNCPDLTWWSLNRI
jgi:hypothetical protein